MARKLTREIDEFIFPIETISAGPVFCHIYSLRGVNYIRLTYQASVIKISTLEMLKNSIRLEDKMAGVGALMGCLLMNLKTRNTHQIPKDYDVETLQRIINEAFEDMSTVMGRYGAKISKKVQSKIKRGASGNFNTKRRNNELGRRKRQRKKYGKRGVSKPSGGDIQSGST